MVVEQMCSSLYTPQTDSIIVLYSLLHFMILAVRYCDILAHLTVAYVAVYSCMCKPICVCVPFIFPVSIVCNSPALSRVGIARGLGVEPPPPVHDYTNARF